MNLTKSFAVTSITAGALFALLSATPANAAKIKCWTNNEGVRECGNVVPPEYAQKGHKEVNKRGMTVGTQARAKTPEEIEKEKLEQEKLERERALAAEQEKKDRVLLATFSSEDDMKLAHEGKLLVMDTRIKHTEQLIAKLKASLNALVNDAAEQERSGKKVSDETRKDIRDVKQQIAENMGFIQEREQEKVELDAQFEAELARFRKLKGQN